MAHLRYSVLYQGKINGVNKDNAVCIVIVGDPNVSHKKSRILSDIGNMYW